MSMSDYLTSVIRTAVPAGWGALVAWLVAAGLLPTGLLEQAEGFGVVLVAVAIAGYYATIRALEPHLPAWATVVLLGSGRPPAYQPAE